MFRTILFVCLAIGAWQWWQNSHSQASKERAARSLASIQTSDTCREKTHCAVIYLAPWCPHCRTFIPTARKLMEAKELKSLGIRVVVGKGTPETNAEMHAQLPAGAELDSDGSLARKWQVDRFPSFFVFDKEGTMVLQHQEAYGWLQEKFSF